MTNLRKLKPIQIAEQGTNMARTRHGLSTMPQLFPEVDNKQLMSIAATVRWKLPFCIALHLDDVFGLVVLGGQGLALDFDDGEDSGRFSCKRR